jgi:hypothetical protein
MSLLTSALLAIIAMPQTNIIASESATDVR